MATKLALENEPLELICITPKELDMVIKYSSSRNDRLSMYITWANVWLAYATQEAKLHDT